ncbi:MAG: ATP-dependent helicase, partial [Aeoliella sp.]
MKHGVALNHSLDQLNDAQREAVQHVEGPLLILAGPGSGKTRVVTHRIAHLLDHGASSRQILALTFTNKAATEMRNRVEALAPGEPVWVSTFHRFGARLLREYGELIGLAPHFTIYDTSDSKQVIKRVIEAEQVQTMHYSPERIAAAISGAKNKLITADAYESRRGSPLSSIVAQVYPAYQQRMLQSAAVDFDDLLMHVAQLLFQSAELRAELDDRFRYVMVDEYQDTNKAQYVILRALSVDHPNLAATGDPDQSIYGWRGADISNILEFESDFPQVRVVRLEQNYRSTQSILRVADELIAHNTQRKKKSLFTENDEGSPVRLVRYADQDQEAQGIAEQIRDAITDGTRSASEFAIFYRVNALSRSMERALRAAGVPYQIIRGQEFFGRKEIKDVLAYCQLANNPNDDVAFERSVNSPARGVGKKSIERLHEHAYRYGARLLDAAREANNIEGLTKRAASQLAKFVDLIDRVAAVAHGSVEEVIRTVITGSGYEKQLKNSEDIEDQSRLENIQE